MRSRVMLIVALLVAALIPMLLDGLTPFSALLNFPLSRLALMLALVMGCWNLNALRLRFLLAGRSGSRGLRRAQQDGAPAAPSPTGRTLTRFSSAPLGQRRAVAMVMATECATCATPGGSGGPLTLMMLLKRHGVHPATSSGLFVIDQVCDMLFFLLALAAMGGYALLHPSAWHRPELIQLASALLVMLW